MTKQEKIQVTIPKNSNWREDDIEKKAKELDMNKTELALKAIDLFYNMDNDFIKMINERAEQMHTSPHIIIQNEIMKSLAKKDAETKVWGAAGEILDNYLTVSDDKGTRMLTGTELYNVLLDKYIREQKHEKKQLEERRNNAQ